MGKVDLKKDLKQLYTASAKAPALVEVPALNFLMVDGQGDPNTAAEFRQAVEALYSVSYTMKFALKKRGGEDYAVMPLEGLWWMKGKSKWDPTQKDKWLWTVMIAQPDFITKADVKAASEEAGKKKPLPALPKLRFERWEEGTAAQILHVGPYAEEGPTILRLHEFVEAEGYRLRGKHHEIYMGDPHRTAPEKLKTILRHPVG